MNSKSFAQSRLSLLGKLGPIILILIAIAVAGGWLMGSFPGLRLGSWQIAEWLINYQSGFIRRGLVGQAIYIFGDGQNLLPLLYTFTFVSYVLYCVIFLAVYFSAKIQSPKLLLMAIFIPGGILPMGMTMQFFVRKEILFLILFGILCLHYLWIQKATLRWRTLGVYSFYTFAIAGGVVMTLIHEGYLFMSYPLTLLLMWTLYRENISNKNVMAMSLLYAVVIPGLFLYCAQYKGDAYSAQLIWDSISLPDRLALSSAAPYTPYGPIASLGWGLQQHFLTMYSGIYSTGGWAYWTLFLIGNTLVLSYIGLSLESLLKARNSIDHPPRYLRVMIFGFLISLLMFAVAADWGRWLAYLSNSLILFSFTLTASPFAQTASPWRKEGGCFSTFIGKIQKMMASPMTLLILAIYMLTFRLPECCISSNLIWFPYSFLVS